MRYGQHIVRRLIAPFRSEVVILTYHRIFGALMDPQRLCVSPRNFAEHLAHLKENYHILTLKELSLALRERYLPKRAVVLTFDDGYVDLFWNAKPLLERFEVPASAFFVTGYDAQDQEFWWDELERLLLLSPNLPDSLDLTVNRRTWRWQMGKWATLTNKNIFDYRGWHVDSNEIPTSRHQAYLDIYHLLRPLEHENLINALSELREQVAGAVETRADYRALRPSEISQLSDGGLVEIGAHTVTHSELSKLTLESQRREIADSRRHLETIIGQPVTSFSYPYGGSKEIGQHGPSLAKEAGYHVACAVFDAPVTRWSDPYLLPRISVLDWSEHEFTKRLLAFFNS